MISLNILRCILFLFIDLNISYIFSISITIPVATGRSQIYPEVVLFSRNAPPPKKKKTSLERKTDNHTNTCVAKINVITRIKLVYSFLHMYLSEKDHILIENNWLRLMGHLMGHHIGLWALGIPPYHLASSSQTLLSCAFPSHHTLPFK